MIDGSPDLPPGGGHIAEGKEPLRLADVALRILWTDLEGRPVLRRWRDRFWLWSSDTGCYLDLQDDVINADLYRLLDQTRYRHFDREGRVTTRPVRPSLTTVREVKGALVAGGTLVDGDSPQWLSPGHQSSPNDILAVTNGLLDVRRKMLLPPTPDFFTTVSSPVAYAPEAAPPKRFKAFLNELWGDDEECADTLAEFCGYCLTLDTSLQKILLLVGPKRSGKGTIVRTLTNLVGPKNVAAPTLSSLGTQFGLSPLLGRSVATITDARLSGRTDQAQITERLLSISGEDLQTVDRKHMSPISTRLHTRFVVVSNELPKLRDSSGALASRFVVLPLTRSFYGMEDSGLEAAIAKELPGILNWALAGLNRLRERGRFVQPSAAKESMQELEDLGSPVAAFLRDQCDQGPHCQVAIKALYRAWTDWADENGFSKGDAASFGRNLRAVVPTLTTAQPRVDGMRDRVYYGVGLVRRDDV